MNSFSEAMSKIRGCNNLILCHDQADSDAIGAAYALSQLIGGDVGVPVEVANHAEHLIERLSMTVIHRPNVTDYTNVVVVDTAHSTQLCDSVPEKFFVIDHHPNNHLLEKAEVALYDTVSSTSQLVYRVIQDLHQPIDRQMAMALCAGILTDTIHFHRGDPEAFQVFGALLQAGGLTHEEILDLYIMQDTDDREAILDAALAANKQTIAGYHIVTAEIASNIPTYGARALFDLGADVSIVGYRSDREVEVRMYIRKTLCDHHAIQAIDLFRNTPSMKKGKTWGYGLFAGFRSSKVELGIIFKDLRKVLDERLTR
ncbi:DHH family phosphoesterase [Effusibacillus dendaii]|uniref:Phosphoesterase n=1 Tax=Effusibacillus dendaii TaxID=2743772 RepID=A0A7I8DBH0_9BACL|nr:DHH family phosphoesterase [Effusibacillus dendaii]BCJ87424.1 phosphoesterase [Effusibacillus dendaii]